jgi:hypothetical protein
MLANRCIRLAGIYLMMGMTMGIVMGATHDFSLRAVHAHINLLGWVGLAIAAGVFKLWPNAEQSRLAHGYFWLYNVALPTMLGALAVYLRGRAEVLPVLVAGQIGVFAAMAMFVLNLFLAPSGGPRQSERLPSARATVSVG